MLSKPSSPQTDELVLVFDIGSSSVGGALLYLQNSNMPKIIFSIREPIVVENTVDTDQFLSSTLKALGNIANKIYEQKLGAPKRIFCVLSSPWYVSQIRTINLKKNTSFVFTPALADSLVQKEISLFEEQHLSEYVKSGNPIRPIELKSMKTTLNGYATAKPYNQKAKEISITLFISMSPAQVLTQMEEVIGKYFHVKEIKFSSFVMTAFTVVRDMFTHQENFLLVDIGGEVTDISMVKKDMLRESISFPMGRNFMTRGVASALSCSLDEAKSFISLYKDGHIADETLRKIEPIITKLKADWLNKFQESLAHISSDISIPATIFLTVDQALSIFFSDIIKTEQFSQYTLTDSKFQIILLSTEILHGIASFDDNITRDPFIIIESVYINRFLR